MKTDYPELAGKEVDITLGDGEVGRGIVVDANYHVGITIVWAEDKERELMCLNRNQFLTIRRSNLFDEMMGERGEDVGRMDGWKRIYKIVFHTCIQQIKMGHVTGLNKLTSELVDEISNDHNPGMGGGIAECAWKS